MGSSRSHLKILAHKQFSRTIITHDHSQHNNYTAAEIRSCRGDGLIFIVFNCCPLLADCWPDLLVASIVFLFLLSCACRSAQMPLLLLPGWRCYRVGAVAGLVLAAAARFLLCCYWAGAVAIVAVAGLALLLSCCCCRVGACRCCWVCGSRKWIAGRCHRIWMLKFYCQRSTTLWLILHDSSPGSLSSLCICLEAPPPTQYCLTLIIACAEFEFFMQCLILFGSLEIYSIVTRWRWDGWHIVIIEVCCYFLNWCCFLDWFGGSSSILLPLGLSFNPLI